jgi:hypothetical protein
VGTPTYTPLANITLSSAVSTVTFSSIPSTYQDLIIQVVATGSTTLAGRIRLNNDSASDYDHQGIRGTGSTGQAFTAVNQSAGNLSSSATATAQSELQIRVNILAYRNQRHKLILSRADNVNSATEFTVVRYHPAPSVAVTSVQILTSTGNWLEGSTFALYGVIA